MIIFNILDRKEVNLPKHVQYIYEVDCGFGDGTHALLLVVQIVKKSKSVLLEIVNQYMILPERWKNRNCKVMHQVGNPNRNNGWKNVYYYRIEFPCDQNEEHLKILKAIQEWDKKKY